MNLEQKPIPPSDYTRDYYLTSCQGHEEFISTFGKKLPLRLKLPLNIASIQPGMFIVDIGCGRGEIIRHCALEGAIAWGLDYSWDAVSLSRETLSVLREKDIDGKIGIQQADAKHLPLKSESVDVVFMLDVVEHLLPEELSLTLSEINRILKPGGRLIIHTMPNLWYYRFGYPVYRLLQRFRGDQLPANPRERWTYSHVHINEQTPRRLRKTLALAGFNASVWLKSTVSYRYEGNLIVRSAMEFLTRAYPFKLIFCNDIFAVGIKS